MNAIAPRGNASTAVAALSSLKQGLQNVAATIVATGGDPFLRLLTDGTWCYGAENVEVQTDSLWAVNPYSLQHGWVSWTDHPGKQANEIVGEVMVPMTSPLPPKTELQDTGWEWSQQLSIQLKCLTGEDVGTQVMYKTTSVGGMNAVKALIAKLMTQLDADPDNPVPVLTLDMDSYQHKKWGKTYTPIFDVKKWIALDAEPDEQVEADEPAEEKTVAEAPKRTRRAAPQAEAKKPEPEPAAEKPTVTVTAADRRAALLAELAKMEADPEEEADEADAPEEASAEPAPRRRRRN